MLRQLINIVRYTLQAIRKYIKPLILIVSFLTFIWLIVDTTHRPEFVRHAAKHSARHNQTSAQDEQWDAPSVDRFLELLEIDPYINSTVAKQWPLESCPHYQSILLTAFAGGSLVEGLWQYVSLVALRHSELRPKTDTRTVWDIKLPISTYEELGLLFSDLPIETLSETALYCHDIANTCILNDDTRFELPMDRNQLYILNNDAKRLREILDVSWEDQAMYFRLKSPSLQIANEILIRERIRAERGQGSQEAGAAAQFVGIKIGNDDGLTFEYYYRAITFQRKMYDGDMLLFIVICENVNGAICSTLKGMNSEHISVIAQNTEMAVDFGIMRLCNHSILSSERDIFPALLRGKGTTVVYGYNDNENNVALQLANFKDYWYTIV